MPPPTLSLAIVTTCHNYGIYLDEWARSILALKDRPAQVVIVENGSTDESPQQADQAADLLRRAGLPVTCVHTPKTDFGTARNRAVSLATTEWVMHLDCDDTIMPHAVGDIAALAPHADVVALGYTRTGDLAAGPPQRTKLYRSSAGHGVLVNPCPASGVSPFRKSFWERAPYRTDMRGGWDTALWLGFGHLGARILATRRPCFWYRQHADSVFNTRRKGGWNAAFTGQQLVGRRRGDHGVSVLVPRSEDDTPARLEAWAWVRQWYAAHFPEWELLEGKATRHNWVKGDAVNAALAKARGAVLVVADADCVVPPEALRDAVHLVETGRAPWVVPHRKVHRLTPAATAEWLKGEPSNGFRLTGLDTVRPAYAGIAGGGIFVVARPAFAAMGGIPSAFVGWGAEDEALALILDTLVGAHIRFEHDLAHLWHPPQEERRRSSQVNRAILQRFRGAQRQPALMWTLLQESLGLHGAAARRSLDRAAQAARSRAGLEVVVRESFAERQLARQREGKMRPGPSTNKMMPGPSENKGVTRIGGKYVTHDALAFARRHGLTDEDIAAIPSPGVGLSAVRIALRKRAAAR